MLDLWYDFWNWVAPSGPVKGTITLSDSDKWRVSMSAEPSASLVISSSPLVGVVLGDVV